MLYYANNHLGLPVQKLKLRADTSSSNLLANALSSVICVSNDSSFGGLIEQLEVLEQRLQGINIDDFSAAGHYARIHSPLAERVWQPAIRNWLRFNISGWNQTITIVSRNPFPGPGQCCFDQVEPILSVAR